MGKPFHKEIEKIHSTFIWALDQDIEKLSDFLLNNSQTPLFIVGSGGSLSACYLASFLYQKGGMIAKAITPLELYYTKESLKSSKILFISASGKNTDILFSFNIAAKQEPKSILAICMRRNTPIFAASKQFSNCKTLEYEIPTKKDGFLATNTLVSYYILLCRAFGCNYFQSINEYLNIEFISQVNEFVKELTPAHSLTILFGGLGQSIALDIESKFTEAALGSVSISDYRNFGHGRHHWFAKREKTSAILALITPMEREIANRTIDIIPITIPRLIIESKNKTTSSSIELLIKSFHLVNAFGQLQNIDPGKPGVPEFGRKLYNLKYSTLYKIQNEGNHFMEELHIKRKLGIGSVAELSIVEQKFWINKYREFLRKLRSTNFGIVIFDYDGTLCPFENRYTGIPCSIKEELIRLLNQDIIIGIATGRGKSVRDTLLEWVPTKYLENVIIGYYNGSEVGSLKELNLPQKDANQWYKLNILEEKIIDLRLSLPNFNIELKPKQLTIFFEGSKSRDRIINAIREIINQSEF